MRIPIAHLVIFSLFAEKPSLHSVLNHSIFLFLVIKTLKKIRIFMESVFINVRKPRSLPKAVQAMPLWKRLSFPFPFPHSFASPPASCARRGGGKFSLKIALALLLSIPIATAQSNVTSRKPSQDFTAPKAAGNNSPNGIWSDGTTMWVADYYDAVIYAYKMSDKTSEDSEDEGKKFETLKAAGNTQPTGIWSDGTTMWAADKGEDKLFAYKMSDRSRDPTKDIELASDNRNPTGIWSDKTTMWVADTGSSGENNSIPDRIYAYNMWTNNVQENPEWDGVHDSAKDIDTVDIFGNRFIQGIWSDGITMWAAEFAGRNTDRGHKLYAFNLLEKTREVSKDFYTLSDAGNRRPRGIWSDGETMWVADAQDSKLYAYHSRFFARNDKQDFNTLTDAGNAQPYGLWSDGRTLWVVNNSTNDDLDKIFAYDLSTKKRETDKDFATLDDAENNKPTGLWSDGTTMWVADYDDNKLYAYKMSDKSYDESEDISLASGNTKPTALWSDKRTMYVADEADKIFAYNLGDTNLVAKIHLSSKNIPTKWLDLNRNPTGIWSDGATMWVADNSYERNLDRRLVANGKIFAYKMADKSRDESKDFETYFNTLNMMGNADPRGIWSDSTTMWVSDLEDGKIYAYRLSDSTTLYTLTLTGHIPSTPSNSPEYANFKVPLDPPFERGATQYKASVSYASTNLTVLPTTLYVDPANVSILPADVDDATNGHQVNLVGNSEITITVTNRNSLPQTRTYTITVEREFFTYNDPSKNIQSTNLVSVNMRGLWFDAQTMWVVDYDSTFSKVIENMDGTKTTNIFKKIFAYNRTTKQPDADKNFELDTRNFLPRGLWSDGETMWVADSGGAKVYAYKMSDKTRDETKDFSGLSRTVIEENEEENIPLIPNGLWSDGETMWITDEGSGTIYAYDVESKTRKPSGESGYFDENLQELLRGSGNTNPSEIWSDGSTIWVADSEDKKLYAYKLPLGESPENCREESKDFNTLKVAGNNQPWGLWSDGSTMWVADNTTFSNIVYMNGTKTTNIFKKIFAYNQPLSGNALLERLSLTNVYYGYNTENTGHFSEHFEIDKTNYPDAYVVYSTESTTVDAVAQDPNAVVGIKTAGAAGKSLVGNRVNLNEGINTITIAVTAENGDVKQYTINVARISGGRTPIRYFSLEGDRANAIGIWGNEETIWVTDRGSKQIYAYNKDNGVRETSKDFTHTGTQTPKSIWGNGETIWVVNDYDARDDQGETIDGKLYAYNMWTNNEQESPSWDGSRVPGKDIPLATSNPRGIWGNATTMWVAEEQGKLYAYKRELGGSETEENRRVSAEDFNTLIDAENGAPWGIWSNASVMWVLDWDDNKIYAYNSTTKERILVNNKGNRDINGLEGTSGSSRGIWSDDTTMWVANGRKLYAYNLPQPGAAANSGPSEDFALSDLRLSGIELSPVFSPDNLYYRVLVNHDVASTTVTATPNDSGAVVEILWSSDRSATARTANRGRQVALSEDYNFIAVDVTAENGDMQSYVVWVTKAEAPPASGGPLPAFQSASVGNNPTADSASSSTVLEKGQSQFIFAESLLDGDVRFVFLVPPEELKIETTPDLLGGHWRALPEDEFQSTRESNVDGQDRLTIILPKAAGKQRFLRLTPQR